MKTKHKLSAIAVLLLFFIVANILIISSISVTPKEEVKIESCSVESAVDKQDISIPLVRKETQIFYAPLLPTEELILEVSKESTTKEEEPEKTPKEKPKKEEHKPVFNYTEEDLDLLSRLIHAESGIESYDTQLKIGSVVMNRVLSPHFPNTIREVIYQENQFSVTFISKNGVMMIDYPADDEAKKAAYEILNYGSVLPKDVQVFYEKSITTGWVATRTTYGTFDHTTFAYIY